MSFNTKINLYVGGNDGGFTINRKEIYINYGMYAGNIKELIKIMNHELYHSRNISLKDRFIFFLESLLNSNMVVHKAISKIIEESIACLVQQGPVLEKDDPTGTLTKRNLLLLKKEFDLLNQIIIESRRGIQAHKKIDMLNVYSIGYHIVSTIYNNDKKILLNRKGRVIC